MSKESIFLDTAFVLALLNRRDQHHTKAKSLSGRLRAASEIWMTEAVLTEIGNGLSAINRKGAADFIESCYKMPKMKVVTVDSILFKKALNLYQSRNDKNWGLTDCISFVVMREHGLYLAMTTDEHFRQAGFNPLMVS